MASNTDLPAVLNTPEKLNIGSTTLGLTHPLLGKVVATNAYSGLHAWSSEIDVFTLPYLKDHKFQSSEDAVIPGAMYVEMALALALHMFPDVLPRLHDVTFDNLLTLSTNEIARFCTRLDTTGRPGARHGYHITTVEGNGNEILVSKGMVSFDETLHHCKKGNIFLVNEYHKFVLDSKTSIGSRNVVAFLNVLIRKQDTFFGRGELASVVTVIAQPVEGRPQAPCQVYDSVIFYLFSTLGPFQIRRSCFQTTSYLVVCNVSRIKNELMIFIVRCQLGRKSCSSLRSHLCCIFACSVLVSV